MNSNDIHIAKYTSNGDLIWSRTAGGPNLLDRGNIVVCDEADNIYVSGMMSHSNSVYFDSLHILFPFGVFNAAFVAKYLSYGNIQWVRYVYSTSFGNYTTINDIDCLSDGSVVFTGGYSDARLRFSNGFSSIGSQTAGNPDFFLTHFSSNGDRLWLKVFLPLNCYEGGMLVTIKNDVIHVMRGISGIVIDDVDTLPSYGSFDILLEQYTPNGNLLAYTQMGGTNIESGTDLVVQNNSIYLIGATQSPTVNVGTDSFAPEYSSSMYIVKLSQSPIGISPVEQGQQGAPYSNPNSGSFTLTALGLLEAVSVTDVTGKVAYSGTVNAFGKTEVQLNVPSGVYVVHYEANGTEVKQKVVIR